MFGDAVFQRSTAILTLGMTILHAALGCCCHRAHASQAPAAHHDQTVRVATQHCGHRHVHNAASNEHRADRSQEGKKHRHDHQQCDNQQCVFMVGPRAELTTGDDSFECVISPVPPAMLFAGAVPPTAFSIGKTIRSAGRCCAHARHWTQVWLI